MVAGAHRKGAATTSPGLAAWEAISTILPIMPPTSPMEPMLRRERIRPETPGSISTRARK